MRRAHKGEAKQPVALSPSRHPTVTAAGKQRGIRESGGGGCATKVEADSGQGRQPRTPTPSADPAGMAAPVPSVLDGGCAAGRLTSGSAVAGAGRGRRPARGDVASALGNRSRVTTV
ncbi:hypothetical protein GCM10022416_34400 [Actinomadura keratinilytica]|uniref:Uncharacterized protein n=1 Tax=Actinomadura keratinilytica TaxID=547461 RepID=A0ABP7YZ54_9ACTN